MNLFENLQIPPILDRLLAKARATLFHYPAELRITCEISDQDELNRGLARLGSSVKQALRFLSGTATLDLSPGMEDLVRQPLAVLDNAVLLGEYLSTANENLPAVLVDRAVFLGCMTMGDTPVPYHRLIPLNTWRRRFRDGLPVDVQYLFPWYDVWSGEDELLLQEFIDLLPSLRAGDFSRFREQDGIRFRALFDDILRDSRFFSHLEKCHRLLLRNIETIGKDQAIALFFLAEKSDPARDLSDAVVQKGFHATAWAAMNERPKSEESRHELLFLAAFAGPELEDEERMELFEKVIAFVKNSDNLQSNVLLAATRRWSQHKLADREMADLIYGRWIDLLEQSTGRLAWSAIYQAGNFRKAVDSLKTCIIIIDSLLDALWQKITAAIDSFGQSVSLQPAFAGPQGMLSEDEGISRSLPSSITRKRLRYATMPQDGCFLKGDEAKDLIEALGDYILYFGCLAVDDKGERTMAKEVSRLPRTKPYRIELGENKACIIGIGADMSILNKAINALKTTDEISCTEALDNVVWIIYQPRKKT